MNPLTGPTPRTRAPSVPPFHRPGRTSDGRTGHPPTHQPHAWRTRRAAPTSTESRTSVKLAFATTAPESTKADVLIVFSRPTDDKRAKNAGPRLLAADTLPAAAVTHSLKGAAASLGAQDVAANARVLPQIYYPQGRIWKNSPPARQYLGSGPPASPRTYSPAVTPR